jgi:hypothetical protein
VFEFVVVVDIVSVTVVVVVAVVDVVVDVSGFPNIRGRQGLTPNQNEQSSAKPHELRQPGFSFVSLNMTEQISHKQHTISAST